MDKSVLPIKIEPEEDLKCLQQEIKLEMKTEIDLPIKSELEEGSQCYQKHRSQLPPLTFPLIKEELYDSTNLDLLIKSERVCEIDEPLYQYQESGPFSVTFPPIKDEVNEILDESGSQIFIGKNMLSKEGDIKTKYQSKEYLKIRTKYNKQSLAKLKGCKKQSIGGILLNVKKQVVVNILNEGVSVLSMEGFRLNVYVKKIIVLNMLNEEGSVLNTVEPELNVKKKVVLNMLNEEGSVLNMVEPLVNVKRKVVLNIPEEGVSVIVMEDLLLNVKKEVVLNMLK